MNNKILVTYISRTSWTVGVAKAIGKTLAESGARVDMLTKKKGGRIPPSSFHRFFDA